MEEYWGAAEVESVDGYEFYLKRTDSYAVDYIGINAQGMRFPLCAKIWIGDKKVLKTLTMKRLI